MSHTAMRTYGETLPEHKFKNEIAFYPSQYAPWVMKINGHGELCFNREAYQTWEPGDFADAVIKSLELNYKMKWEIR